MDVQPHFSYPLTEKSQNHKNSFIVVAFNRSALFLTLTEIEAQFLIMAELLGGSQVKLWTYLIDKILLLFNLDFFFSYICNIKYPFNPTTTIQFSLGKAVHLNLDYWDLFHTCELCYNFLIMYNALHLFVDQICQCISQFYNLHFYINKNGVCQLPRKQLAY